MPSGWKRNLSFTAVVLGFFMALLDSTIVNVTLPEMTRHFATDMDSMSWVVNGYNLAFAVFLVTASRLADQFGRKKLFIIGISLFVLSSLLAGLSVSLPLLITFRVLQGLAAAIVVPVTVPLTIELFPPSMQGAVIGIWGAISGLAAASGPTLGGVLTDSFGWQAIFYVNIPLGLICIVLSVLLLRESYDSSAGRTIDWWGMLILSAAMFALTYALIQANEWGWSSPAIIGLLTAALVLAVVFVLVELKTREPMLPLWMFRIKAFNWASLTLFIVGAGIMTATFLMSYFLTGLMGKTVLEAGMIISTMSIATMLTSALVGAKSNRYGSRYFAATGIALMAVSIYADGSLHVEAGLYSLLWRLALMGIAIGLVMAPVMGSVIRNVPQEKAGIASGITNMSRALGSVLGVAVLVTVLSGAMNHASSSAQQDIASWVKMDQGTNPVQKEGFLQRLQAVSGAKGAGAAGLSAVIGQLEELRAKDPSLEQLIPRVEQRIQAASAEAFRHTFHYGGLVLLLGVPCAFLSDKRRREADQEAGDLPEQRGSTAEI